MPKINDKVQIKWGSLFFNSIGYIRDISDMSDHLRYQIEIHSMESDSNMARIIMSRQPQQRLYWFSEHEFKVVE